LRQQSVIQGTSRITLPIIKRELADYLGVQRPSLFRELKKMKDEGMVGI
jgi:CRP-like cAMP-binding protein